MGDPRAQRTLALIRPSALAHHKDKILEKIKENGFKIGMMKKVQLDRQQAEEFYAEHQDKPFFEDLVKEMTRYINNHSIINDFNLYIFGFLVVLYWFYAWLEIMRLKPGETY